MSVYGLYRIIMNRKVKICHWKYIFIFCVSSQIVTWYNLLRIKNIFCILCALRVCPHLQLSSYTVRNLHSDYRM